MSAFQSRFEKEIPPLPSLKDEVEEICNKVISKAQSPVVFCHNDALCANFILDERQGNSENVSRRYRNSLLILWPVAVAPFLLMFSFRI